MIEKSIEVHQSLAIQSEDIKKAAEMLVSALKEKNKIFICGNGGSAAEAQHFSAELIGRFEKERTALPCIALTTDSSNLTALGNDYGFDTIFRRQIEALGNKNDVLLCLSSSGNSNNLIEAVAQAKNNNMKVINLLGKNGGKMKQSGDIDIIIASDNTARVQECHLLILHIFAKIIEDSIWMK
jgi:D-sedoheptulose 7-phosphate isomerase